MKTISTNTDYKCVKKEQLAEWGWVVYQLRRWPAEYISYNRSNLSLSNTQTYRQTDAHAHKPDQMPQNHHTMQEGMIQYVTTQILHTFTITESYHNIRALPVFKLASFTKKGKEIASCERDICHWPSEGGE